MKDFEGRLAVVTGGGSGIGRELARQLAASGCSLALCDISLEALDQTRALIGAESASKEVRVTTHIVDVSDEAQLVAFRDAVATQHGVDHLNLLFNNAGIGAGGSMFTDRREVWDRTFAICWGGVYLGVRTFLPLLQAADAAHIVNVASINSVWATLGPNLPHTAYVAAKFAVRGFTEALIADLRVNAPHIGCSVVMPGHVGTPIVSNSLNALRGALDSEVLAAASRARLVRAGVDPTGLDDDAVQARLEKEHERFRESAPTTPAQTAAAILEGVRAGHWRILVGDDAKVIDRLVREDPEAAYDQAFFDRVVKEAGWGLGR